jgi:hypothetical protein
LTRIVPTSAIDSILLREVLGHLGAETVARLEEDEVAAVGENDCGLSRNRGEIGCGDRAGDEVVLARDDERRGRDLWQVRAEVERRPNLVVEQEEGIRNRDLAPEGVEGRPLPRRRTA